MSGPGVFQTELVTITKPAASEVVGPMGMLTSTTGICKLLYPSGLSRTLASVQVFVKPFVDDATEPNPPTDLEWNGNPNANPPITPAGVVPSENIEFIGGDTQEYHWTSGGFTVRTSGNGKNKMWVRAKWVVDPAPPTYQFGFENDDTSKVFVATTTMLKSTEAEKSAEMVAPAAHVAVTAASTSAIVSMSPTCRDGDWFLYKDIPASTTGRGVRLMLNEYMPLRASELDIAAADVHWDLGSESIRYLGIRRACGSNFGTEPAGSPLVFAYRTLPRWAIVMDQIPGTPWTPNPFVVLSHSRCHPDTAVVNPSADIYVRLNYPAWMYLVAQGAYSLWINPRLGISACCEPPCHLESCVPF